VAQGARAALDAGAACALVNCVPALHAMPYVRALGEVGASPFGVYANAGEPADAIGWSAGAEGSARHEGLAAAWRDAGASVVGGCCGTGPAHVRALAASVATI